MFASPTIADGMTPKDDPRLALRLGLAVTLLFAGVLLTWSVLTTISGAVVASGQISVRGKAQTVQTLDGGEVVEILVQDGDRVRAGDVLVRLDPTFAQANLDMARVKLSEALARQSRLEAEQLGLAAPGFQYPDLPFPLPDLSRQEEGQRQIFKARADVLLGQREQLARRKEETSHQVEGLRGQLGAKEEQLALVLSELTSTDELVRQGLARRAQLNDLQRSEAELRGQVTELQAELARLANSVEEAELNALQAERAFKEAVVTELREATAEIEELTLEILTRQDQLGRIDIRAPADGIVHQLQVSTVGAVLAPGAALMDVIPRADGLDFQVQVDPHKVSHVHPGQSVEVVMSALPSRSTPKLHGKVESVSPDAIVDPRSGRSHYAVKIVITEEELQRLGAVDLMPGMPIEAYLQTGDRTVLDYLLAPLTDQIGRAFREP